MYQKIIVVGNLGGDPEMRYMPNGNAVTNFNMATSRSWNDPNTGQRVEKTVWFRVSAWGRLAETTNQYLSKGKKVLVEGRMEESKPFQRQDGTWSASLNLTAETVQFLSSGRDESAEGGVDYGQPAQSGGNDDIPF